MWTSSTFGHLPCLLFSQVLKSCFPSCSTPCFLLKSLWDVSCLQTSRPDLGEHPATSPTGHHAAAVIAPGWRQPRQWLVLWVQEGWPIAFLRGRTHELPDPPSPWPKRSPSPISVQGSQLVAARWIFVEESWAWNTSPIFQIFSSFLAGWS